MKWDLAQHWVLVPAKLAILHPVTDQVRVDAGGVVTVVLALPTGISQSDAEVIPPEATTDFTASIR
jgi:hypothetical protein